MQAAHSRQLELEPETVGRLSLVAAKLGRDPEAVALEAIDRYLEDREDYEIAAARVREAVPGTAVPIEKLIAELDLGN